MLHQVPLDTDRIKLLNMMFSAGSVPKSILNATSTYYDSLNEPASPVYCTTFTGITGWVMLLDWLDNVGGGFSDVSSHFVCVE